MSRQIKIVSTQWTDNQTAVDVHAVTYQGSAPFSGTFVVFSLEDTIREDETGRFFIDVFCHFGEDMSEDAPVLEFELLDPPMSVLGIEGDMEVVTRIDWA